ncbi:Hypothetical predicted protein [Olea europaea subsp. europaea]|uniref:Uncharacterized protein n=1 Tax=Olea europaea subsp. europaea TaxID=158383 RepID=A0A8S0TRC2_OLEEU|nr:Hypothetical predicted protein [Olea europaea subsp. europaea]
MDVASSRFSWTLKVVNNGEWEFRPTVYLDLRIKVYNVTMHERTVVGFRVLLGFHDYTMAGHEHWSGSRKLAGDGER